MEPVKPKELPEYEVAAGVVKEAVAIAQGGVEVIDEPTADRATAILGSVSATLKIAKDQRLAATKPHRDAEKAINAEFNELTASLKASEKALKKELVDYKQRRAAEAERERRRQERLAAERQEREDERARKEEREPVQHVAPPIIEPANTREVAGTKAVGQTRWKCEVVDPKLVPATFLMPNEKAIRAAVAAGAREIAGVRIWPEEDIAVRT